MACSIAMCSNGVNVRHKISILTSCHERVFDNQEPCITVNERQAKAATYNGAHRASPLSDLLTVRAWSKEIKPKPISRSIEKRSGLSIDEKVPPVSQA